MDDITITAPCNISYYQQLTIIYNKYLYYSDVLKKGTIQLLIPKMPLNLKKNKKKIQELKEYNKSIDLLNKIQLCSVKCKKKGLIITN